MAIKNELQWIFMRLDCQTLWRKERQLYVLWPQEEVSIQEQCDSGISGTVATVKSAAKAALFPCCILLLYYF